MWTPGFALKPISWPLQPLTHPCIAICTEHPWMFNIQQLIKILAVFIALNKSWFWCFQVFTQIIPLQLPFLNLINSYYYLWLHCILVQALIWSSKNRACSCVLGLLSLIFFPFWNSIISSNLVACFYMADDLSISLPFTLLTFYF